MCKIYPHRPVDEIQHFMFENHLLTFSSVEYFLVLLSTKDYRALTRGRSGVGVLFKPEERFSHWRNVITRFNINKNVHKQRTIVRLHVVGGRNVSSQTKREAFSLAERRNGDPVQN